MTVDASSRFRRARPCPICRGGDDMPRGKGRRCSGYLSSDGRFAFCTREEHAGRLGPQPTDPVTWRHLLEGDCHCGVEHAPARTGTIRTTYFEYHDEQGDPLFRVGRLDRSDGKRIWQERHEQGAWIKQLGDVRRVLYRLPTLADADTVHVAEGEPCADALARLGLVATTSPGGAGKWRAEYADMLAGASHVVIWADCDEKGRQHARQIADSLAGRVRDVRVLELDRDRTDGYDVADLIAAAGRNGHSDDVRGYLEQIAENTPLHQPRPGGDTVGTRTVSRSSENGETVFVSPCPDVSRDTGQDTAVSDDSVSPELRFQDAAAFAAFEEPGAAPIVGDAENVLVPEDADVMFYGDGGAGKTTMMLDLALHLAGGDDWLGIRVGSPVRVGIVENEGPRPLFRAKLRRKLAAWRGSDLAGRLLLLEEPWAEVSLDDPVKRRALAAAIAAHGLDVLMLGPVTRSGMNEAGTLQQVRDYTKLLDEVRKASGRRVTFLLAHHENRGGTVSGAWEGAVDTLFHVQAQGHGQTRLYVQKARWSTEHHKQKLQLVWADGEGFEVVDEPDRDDNTIADELLAFVLANGGTGWVHAEQGIAGKGARLRAIRDNLLSGGRLVNRGTETRMRLWHADDPAVPAVQEGLA